MCDTTRRFSEKTTRASSLLRKYLWFPLALLILCVFLVKHVLHVTGTCYESCTVYDTMRLNDDCNMCNLRVFADHRRWSRDTAVLSSSRSLSVRKRLILGVQIRRRLSIPLQPRGYTSPIRLARIYEMNSRAARHQESGEYFFLADTGRAPHYISRSS